MARIRSFNGGDNMTAQIEELLILDGKKSGMAFCPLVPVSSGREGLLELSGSSPFSTDRVAVTPEATFHERIETGEWPSDLLSTGCWRRYIGTWEIKDGRLYLNELVGCFHIVGEGPLFADWVTAVLRIREGKVLRSVHMGYASVFETELHIKVESGIVAGKRRIDNTTKKFDRNELAYANLPGDENRFEGDDFQSGDEIFIN